MTVSSRRLLVAGLLGALSFSASVLPAYAGFQWTAPAAAPVVAPQASVPAPSLPSVPVISQDLPQTIDDMGSAPQAVNVLPTVPDGEVKDAPIYGQGMTDDPITWNTPHSVLPRRQKPSATAAQQPQSVLPPSGGMAVAALSAAPASSGAFDVADGFGADLPLVMAIRQIVPASYGFIFDDGIDFSAHVSWQGGKPWNLVLQETLAPLGLSASVRGNVVSIVHSGAAPMSVGAVMTSATTSSNTQMSMGALPVSMVAAPAGMADAVMMAGGALPAAASADSMQTSATWSAPRNSTLRSILEDWTSRVGVELYWASEYDYPIQSAVNVQGTFEEAVQTLLKGLSESRPRPLARLHPNLPDGPAVLVVETRRSAL